MIDKIVLLLGHEMLLNIAKLTEDEGWSLLIHHANPDYKIELSNDFGETWVKFTSESGLQDCLKQGVQWKDKYKMIQIRRGVFETNSSSMHSIAISNDNILLDTLNVNKDGIVELFGGEFGWGIESYNDAETKASYCWEDNKENLDKLTMLKKVIMDQTGCKDVVFLGSDDYDSVHWSYIDHQSVGTSSEAFESEETLRQFIFNPHSNLSIDNDNH